MTARAASSGRLRRVAGLVRKESLQILRDPSSFLLAGVLPVLLLFLFGFGVSLDPRRIPIGVVVERPTPATESFLASFRNSRYFEVRLAQHRAEVQNDLVSGRLNDPLRTCASQRAQQSRRGGRAERSCSDPCAARRGDVCACAIGSGSGGGAAIRWRNRSPSR